MSYARTPDLPREHPLAKLIERSNKANTLPSCDGCKFGTQTGPLEVSCLKHKSPFDLGHFCAAWEAKT